MATQDRRDDQKRRGQRSEESTALTRTYSTELTQQPTPERHRDERTDQIRASIDQARRQISMSLDEIEHTVREQLDWRGWVDEHPWQTVAIGVGIGFYLGLR